MLKWYKMLLLVAALTNGLLQSKKYLMKKAHLI